MSSMPIRLLLAPNGNDHPSSSSCLPLGGSGRARSIRIIVPLTTYVSGAAGVAGFPRAAATAGSPTLSSRTDTSAPLVPNRGSWPNTR